MEDVLNVYALPYDENCPVICLDEKPYQLLSVHLLRKCALWAATFLPLHDERRKPIPMKQGTPERYDNEYERMGTCSIFVMTEPLKGRHYANARERRTAIDYATEIKWLLTESPYKHAPKVKLIQDNLNIHTIASLYKAFPPAEARSYAKRLELHFTPKHGSWLNIAELTISVMVKQCINRRIATIEQLNSELTVWQKNYSNTASAVNWQFTTGDARVKLRRLYTVV